jgi:glutamate 5-kinase
VDEIRFGDNDALAALVATMVNADVVVVLSDTEGLYDADPRLVEDAQLLASVGELTDELLAAAGGSGSEVGSGGMATKLEAARVLMRAGIPMVLCDGSRADCIRDAVAGRSAGTVFEPKEGGLGARKSWIALGRNAVGVVVVDEGAASALRHRNTSLLPAGVTSVSGEFAAGDAIELRDTADRLVGRGLAGLASADIESVRGLNSVEISELHPRLAGKVVVHRDHLVIL